MSIDQFILLCNRLSMDDKIIRQDVKEALSLCFEDCVFPLGDVNQDNWLKYRNWFLFNVSGNKNANSHDAIMIVLYWFRQFNEDYENI